MLNQFTAAFAVEFGLLCKKEFEMVVEFGHRADRGARRANRVGLVDGDSRRDSLNAFNLRAIHAI